MAKDKKYSFTEFSEERWHAMLHGEQVLLNSIRHFYKILPGDTRCKVCNAPINGPGAIIPRLMGSRPYPKNPRVCTTCLWTGEVGGAEIELTMLFADVRGSTSLAEGMKPTEFGEKVNRFYKASMDAIAHSDGWLDNLVGDGVIALYIPGFAGKRHTQKAIKGARDLLKKTGHNDQNPWMKVGIGIHTGTAYVGLMGAEGGVSDLTAVGDAMNTTARLSDQAGEGEILISEEAAKNAGIDVGELESRDLELKGKSEHVTIFVLKN